MLFDAGLSLQLKDSILPAALRFTRIVCISMYVSVFVCNKTFSSDIGFSLNCASVSLLIVLVSCVVMEVFNKHLNPAVGPIPA